MPVHNADIGRAFGAIADLLEIGDDPLARIREIATTGRCALLAARTPAKRGRFDSDQ